MENYRRLHMPYCLQKQDDSSYIMEKLLILMKLEEKYT